MRMKPVNNERQWNEIRLENIKRRFGQQFPLQSIGYLQNFITGSNVYGIKLEFTLRLSSTAETSVDIIDGVTYTCRYPNAVVKLPGISHCYEVSEPRDALYFTYDTALTTSMKQAGLFPLPPVWEVKITPEISEIIRELRDLMRHSQEFGMADRMDLLALKLWQELLFMREAGMKRDDFIEARLHRVASYIQVNLNREIDFDKLIAENGFSRRSFFRHWKTYFDVSPLQYLRDLKMREAKRLLQVTEMRIGDIASSLGFEDLAYFCAVFKKFHAMTPLQCRKNAINKQTKNSTRN